MESLYIQVDLTSPLDADQFEDLTTEHEQMLLPARKSYSVAGAGPECAPHRFMSRDGFLETIREAAGSQPPMTAVACIKEEPRLHGDLTMECFVAYRDQT